MTVKPKLTVAHLGRIARQLLDFTSFKDMTFVFPCTACVGVFLLLSLPTDGFTDKQVDSGTSQFGFVPVGIGIQNIFPGHQKDELLNCELHTLSKFRKKTPVHV